MAIQIIKDASVLEQMGKDLVSHIRDTDERISVYLLSEVIHIEEHRNPTRLNHFFSRIKGSGQRVNAMHNFVQVFGNLKFNEEANSAIVKRDGKDAIREIKGVKSKHARTDETGEIWAVWYSVKSARKSVVIKVRENGQEVKKTLTLEQHFERAQNAPWYTFQPERQPVAFDADAKVRGLLKSLWNVVLSGDAVISQDLMNGLTELAFKTGVVTKPSDIISDNMVAKVPEKFKAALHLVVDNTKSEEEKPETERSTPARTRPAARPAANA